MKMVSMFEAEDGKLFKTEGECLRHELAVLRLRLANDLLTRGESILSALLALDPHRIPWADDDILSKITQSTKFAVPYWQCSQEARFSISYFDLSGRIFCCSSGRDQYQSYLKIHELVRFNRYCAA